jgi:hypothetical protein
MLFLISTVHASNNSPNGFHEIPWGISIEAVADQFEEIEEPCDDSNIKSYRKKNDTLKIGRATADSITYHFWKGKFFGIYATNAGYLGYFLAEISAQLGTPTYSYENRKYLYVWNQDPKVHAGFYGRNFGDFTMYNVDIKREMEIEQPLTVYN